MSRREYSNSNKLGLVLLSGGMDSTTCLFDARENFETVIALSINYGQRHSKEIQYARNLCNEIGIGHKILEVPGVLNGPGTMLTDPSIEIPDISYEAIEGVSPTYVPFRNGTLLSIIAAEAQSITRMAVETAAGDPALGNFSSQEILEMHKDYSAVYFGAHAEDASNWAYPDCTPEFIGSMANAIYVGTYYTVRLRTPLMWMSKQDVVEYGTKLGVPWDKTWSCYKGGDKHCGVCPTCRSRREAFKAAGVDDPTEYAGGNE